MESISCSGSINRLFSSTEKLRFFFDPVQFDLSWPICWYNSARRFSRSRRPCVGDRKDSGKLSSSCFRHCRSDSMDPKFTGQLSYRLFPFAASKATLALKHCYGLRMFWTRHTSFWLCRLTCTLYPVQFLGSIITYGIGPDTVKLLSSLDSSIPYRIYHCYDVLPNGCLSRRKLCLKVFLTLEPTFTLPVVTCLSKRSTPAHKFHCRQIEANK